MAPYSPTGGGGTQAFLYPTMCVRFLPLDRPIPTRPMGGCHPRVHLVLAMGGGGLRGVLAVHIRPGPPPLHEEKTKASSCMRNQQCKTEETLDNPKLT